MKKVIHGKLYDTDTAECVAAWSNEAYDSIDYCSESLYRKRTGEFFLYGDGGPKSPYSLRRGSFIYGNSVIIPYSDAEAKEWVEEHCGGDKYIEIFGEVEG